jgi:putative ABC transport system permease protein
LETIAARLSKNHPDDDSGRKLEAVLLQTEVTGNARSMLLVLVGAVGLLLLMACVNVSNLILSRGLQRQREIATRTALGASRSRIVRQLLAESLLLSFLGGVLGLLLAIWGVDIFRVLAPAGIPRIDELRIEPSLVWVALAISSLAGILSGLAPALHTARPDLNLALKERQSSAPATASRFPLRSFLIVSEVALALILLTGSGLMMQSLLRLLHVNSGIRTDHLLTMDLTLPQARYPGDNHLVLFAQRLMESLQQHPGIENVAITNSTLFRGSMHIAPVIIPGVTNERDIGNQAQEKSVTPDYFRCLGIHVVSGRTFSDRDVQGITRVAVINESLARRYWGSQSPLGKNVILGPNPEDSVQIIGVVADTRDTSLRVGPQPQVYVAFFQGSGAFSQKSSAGIHLLIRTASDPAALISDVRRQIWSQDKDLPITKVQTMAEAISESVSERRFQSLLLGAFAGLGLVLTLVGIYGVISYSVSQRTREIGIRLALGAQRGNVLQYVLREGAQLALLGVVTGLAGSLLAMRLLANQLFGIKATDPATLIFAALLMLAVALAASYIPARRATKVDPMIALRYE